jgi:hypothetical protein
MFFLIRYLFLVILFNLIFLNLKSQNLVSNPSFELYNTPLSWSNWGGDFFDWSTGANGMRIILDWDQYQTPDLFLTACTHTYAGVPVNRFGYSQPKHGNGYVGCLFWEYGGWREYLYEQLSAPLIAGRQYCLSFYVSRSDRNQYAIKNIGAYFSANLPATVTNSLYINATPQVVNQNGFISDTTQWTQIQGCFNAVGGEKYIIFGNFKSNANTDTLFVGTNNPDPSYPLVSQYYSYYYIDDVTLFDALTIGVDEKQNNFSFEIYPNPTTGIINVKVTEINTSVKIFNVIGDEIYSSQLMKGNNSIDLFNFSNGVYFAKLNAGGQTVTNKIVLNK